MTMGLMLMVVGFGLAWAALTGQTPGQLLRGVIRADPKRQAAAAKRKPKR